VRGLSLGQKAVAKRVFTQADITAYNELTSDNGLLYGKSDSDSEKQLVPGPMLGGLVSYLLGTKLPGRGTNWLKQYYSFYAPAIIGDQITAEVEIIRLRPEKDLVNLRVNCSTSNGETVCTGEALVLVTDLEHV
jgi:hypothetical protein